MIPIQTTNGISCVYKDSIASNSNNNYNASQTTCSEYDRMRGRCRNDSNPGSTSYSTPSPKVADIFIYNAATRQCEVSLCAEPRKVLSDNNDPTFNDLYSLRCASASCVNQVDKYLQ